jgi:hypothetical protein
VVLLERYGFLGGAATAAQVGTVCGLYLRDTASTEATPVAGGFVQEFASRLQRATGLGPIRLDAGLRVLPFSPPTFARVADVVVSESENVTVVRHATVAEVRTEAACMIEVRALAWNEPLVIRPGTVVDCTGEATTAELAGVEGESGATDQVPALVFALENLDPSFAERGLVEMRRELRRAVVMGGLPAVCERLSLVPGTGGDGRQSFKLNLLAGEPGSPAWRQVSDWEQIARQQVEELSRFLIENTASCRNARLSSVAPQLGVRSGRRIQGRARLTDEDVLGARKSALGIARGAWPIERWGKSQRPEMSYIAERDYYEIPLDCLRPVGLDNVLAAGRCFSAAAGAMSSARVIGTALATGWAAGTVAAFQALDRPVESAVETIRQQMRTNSFNSFSASR